MRTQFSDFSKLESKKMLTWYTILILSGGVSTVSTLLRCDTVKLRFCPELGMFLNYSKCEGYLDDSNYGSFTKQQGEGMLDVSGIQLRSLVLEYTNFTCTLENVVFLNLSDNQIPSVQNIRCSVPDVKVLDLSRNSITAIERTSFSRMTAMTNLYLTENDITLIESNSFSDLRNLTFLDLSENNILRIDINTLSGLTNLTFINLTNNKISSIMVGAFDGLTNLRSIDMSNNIIFKLDALSFSGAEGLQYLNLRQNQMKHTTFEFISVFGQLDTVDLSQNEFHGLDSGTFSRMNVTKIVMSHTPSLRYVLTNAFVSCPLLKTIDLNHNQHLFYLHGKAIQDTYSTLRHLDLTSSAIQYLSLENLNNQTLVVLKNTNIICDCVNKDILTSFSHTEGFLVPDCPLTENDIHSKDCSPKIVSDIRSVYTLSVGERHSIDCFAVGNPWPEVQWVKEEWNGSQFVYETVTANNRLNLHVTAVTQGGKYGCIAHSLDKEVSKFFNLKVKGIDIGVFVIARAATSIIISWNKTHHELRHVVLHREYEATLNYHVHRLNEYWNVFKLSDLKPETPYEICIGSVLDINDRSCVKSSTTLTDSTAGIHTDYGVVLILVTAALIFGACFITIICKCIKKITRGHKGICMVNSLSKEYFGDVREPVLTYENQFTDTDIMEEEDKTEI